MSQANACMICGLPKPDDAPLGFCPNCLFEGALKFAQVLVETESKPRADEPDLSRELLKANFMELWAGAVTPTPLAHAVGPESDLRSPDQLTTSRALTPEEQALWALAKAGPTSEAPSTNPSAPRDSDDTLLPSGDDTVVLDGGDHTPATRDVDESQPDRSEAEVYPSVPGYEIRGTLGVGGMGIVYKALQVRAGRLVALKMIRRDAHVDFEQLDRFRVEARAVARLRHANIVQIFDVGEVGRLPYFSIEYLGGGTLKDRLAAAPLSPRAGAELLSVLARAIDSAHRAGIVHRDLKPANVLFDVDGTPKVADFGLAKRLEEDGQTMTGQLMGTPSYMAPEQARGENRSVGPLADVYALGAILYETLTGRPPFKGTDVTDTLVMVVFHDPVAPSKLQPKVPRDLETICMKCLLKEPARRYASAGELAEDLDRYLSGRPIKARPTPAWERVAKWARRRPAAAAAVAFGLVVTIGLGAGAAQYTASQRERIRKIDERVARDRLKGTEGLGVARVQNVQNNLTDAFKTLTAVRSMLSPDRRLDVLRRQVDDELQSVRHRLDEEADRSAAQARLADFRQLRDDALFLDGYSASFADETLDASEAGTPSTGEPPRDAKTLAWRWEAPTKKTREAASAALDVFVVKSGAAGQARKDLTLWLTPAQKAEVQSESYLLLLVLSQAVAQALPGEDPVRQAREALQALDRAATLHASTQAYHLRRADCLEKSGDARGARAERERAASLKPDEAFDHFLLGREYYRNNDWDAAESHIKAALRKQPDSFWSHCLLATAELNNRPPRAAEAVSELTACLRDRPTYAWLYLLRGFANGHLGSTWDTFSRTANQPDKFVVKAQACFDEAEDDFQKALKLGLDENLSYVLRMNRGVMRFQRRNLDAAAADFEAAIVLNKERYNAYVSLAQVERKRGHRTEAIDLIGKAIALQPQMAALYRVRAFARLDGEKLPPTEIEGAVRDLETSARLAAGNPQEAAGDHAHRGRLLLRLRRPGDALAAADTALGLAGGLLQAHLVRVSALMEMERFDEVIGSCDAALAGNTKPSPDLYRVRGLARARRNDFVGAIEDYTQALALQPNDRAEVFRNRGWSYIYANSFDLARRDFEAVLRLDSDNTEGYAGRASALARLGRLRDAFADIEKALGQEGSNPRILLIATQVYSLAFARATDQAVRHGRPASRDSLAYETRAADLLAQCLERTAVDRRTSFWRDIVSRDPVLVPLLRNPTLVRRLKPKEAATE